MYSISYMKFDQGRIFTYLSPPGAKIGGLQSFQRAQLIGSDQTSEDIPLAQTITELAGTEAESQGGGGDFGFARGGGGQDWGADDGSR